MACEGEPLRAIGAHLRAALPDCFVTLSCDVLPQIHEYERTSTTVINAYAGQPERALLGSLAARLDAAGIGGRVRRITDGCFTRAGIDPARKQFILIKSRQHFRAGFKAIIRHVVMVSGPRMTTSDYGLYPWARVRRLIYPLNFDARSNLLVHGRS